ncbi:hypothetical protein K461DRAFT_272022 [Myriangium duriaei CBS 260.36]|uniref:2EXR domain-containing protein n=1 Tax=Myriangium duriaei CBS 260.36 TaxID=1168546 RepID=A0A9P4MG34_9PEZI|nr:hypothetical protein K461DRAFT_272022 [Myriangium duriaei CBS 260.36]
MPERSPTFHRFPDLPRELRTEVWRSGLPAGIGPSLLPFRYDLNVWDEWMEQWQICLAGEAISPDFIAARLQVTYPLPLPAAVHASHEARTDILSHAKNNGMSINNSGIVRPFDRHQDILYFGPRKPGQFDPKPLSGLEPLAGLIWRINKHTQSDVLSDAVGFAVHEDALRSFLDGFKERSTMITRSNSFFAFATVLSATGVLYVVRGIPADDLHRCRLIQTRGPRGVWTWNLDTKKFDFSVEGDVAGGNVAPQGGKLRDWLDRALRGLTSFSGMRDVDKEAPLEKVVKHGGRCKGVRNCLVACPVIIPEGVYPGSRGASPRKRSGMLLDADTLGQRTRTRKAAVGQVRTLHVVLSSLESRSLEVGSVTFIDLVTSTQLRISRHLPLATEVSSEACDAVMERARYLGQLENGAGTPRLRLRDFDAELDVLFFPGRDLGQLIQLMGLVRVGRSLADVIGTGRVAIHEAVFNDRCADILFLVQCLETVGVVFHVPHKLQGSREIRFEQAGVWKWNHEEGRFVHHLSGCGKAGRRRMKRLSAAMEKMEKVYWERSSEGLNQRKHFEFRELLVLAE